MEICGSVFISLDESRGWKSQPRTAAGALYSGIMMRGGMKCVASFEAKAACGLAERLQTEAIPIEVRTVTQDSGLDFSEILVEDSYYERACDVAETWEAERVAEVESRVKRRCPKCGSQHLAYDWLDNLTPSAKCKDCGHEFVI